MVRYSTALAIGLLLLVSVNAVSSAASSRGPLVGKLTGNVLTMLVNSKQEQLVMDLDAPISRTMCSHGEKMLAVTLNSTNGANPTGPARTPGIPFRCSRKSIAGLLATSPKSLPAQFASKRRIHNKFSYCLASPPSTSPILFGVDSVMLMLNRNVSSLLRYTPLVRKPKAAAKDGFYIGVNGLRYNGTALSLPASTFSGGVKISSTQAYTSLARPAYLAVRDAFRKLKLPRVRPVAPFATCFNATGLGSTRLGPPVPSVDVKLRSVTWTWFGASTLAFPGDGVSVACLALLDAGPPPATSVIGRFQQMHHLVELDVERKRFGFTGLLFGIQTTCANFNFTLST